MQNKFMDKVEQKLILPYVVPIKFNFFLEWSESQKEGGTGTG